MNKVIGITMVKDELDILPVTIDHMRNQVDNILVWDDESSDGTREYLDKLHESGIHLVNRYMENSDYQKDTVFLHPFTKQGYYQSKKMTALAKLAYHHFGADWVIPFDADEIWTSQWGTLKEVCHNHEDTYGIIQANLYDHMVTGFDAVAQSPIERMLWRRKEALPLPKVACRTHSSLKISQGNHYANYAIPARMTEEAPIVVHHYPYRSREQFIRKVRNGAAAYAKTDLPETAGAHWREWGKFTDEQLIDLFDTFYYVGIPSKGYYINDEFQPELIKDPPRI